MSDFLDAAKEMLAEYGEPVTLINRSGTSVGTAVNAYVDPAASHASYYPEGDGNAEALGLCTVYFAGDVTVNEGFRIGRAAGTLHVLEVGKPQDGTTVAINIAKCRSL